MFAPSSLRFVRAFAFQAFFLAALSRHGASSAHAGAPANGEALAPATPIQLFNGKNLEGWTSWLKDSQHEDPKQVFTVKDRMIVVSGDGYGYIATKQPYRDYRLVVEYRWGPRLWKPREKAARDSGVLVHGTGQDGNAGAWLASIEAQIIEGGVGDFIVIRPTAGNGPEIPVSLTAETIKDRDGELVWKKGGTPAVVTGGRVNWYGRDVDWSDTLDFRGKADVDSPLGEWTKLEIVAAGDRVQNWVNGTLVNEATQVFPTAGRILLQTECAEIHFRRVELLPLEKEPAK